MHTHHHSHHVHHASKRLARPAPIPEGRVPDSTTPEPPSMVRRDGSTSATTCSGTHCNSTSSSLTTTLPVILAVVLPIVCALIVLIYLHRRHVKKLRHEDIHDKYKSLDFGLGVAASAARRATGNPKVPEMTHTAHSKRGLSIDMLSSPYLLPPGLHNSRDSLRSLSRSLNGDDDKYLHAANFLSGDNGSVRSFRSHSRGQDDASSISPSVRHGSGEDANKSLLKNAQRMSTSSPPTGYHSRELTPSPESDKHPASLKRPSPLTQQPLEPGENDDQIMRRTEKQPEASTSVDTIRPGSLSADIEHGDHDVPPKAYEQSLVDQHFLFNQDHPHLGQAMTTIEPIQTDFHLPSRNDSSSEPLSIPHVQEPSRFDGSVVHPNPRISLPASDDASDYGDDQNSNAPLPTLNISAVEQQQHFQKKQESNQSSENRDSQRFPDLNYGYDPHRLTIAIRPLPPDDPSDNPEQRANRIRSFYKEYFDESKPGPRDSYYYYDDGGEYEDGYFDDYHMGDYIPGPPKPFAQPVGRRAMTPPPRAPPGGPSRHMGYGSVGGFFPPEIRPYSSASGRLPTRGPSKPLPPPEPLHVLPSPHLLKDDMSIMPIEYAPGRNIKDRRAGRPETPQGGLRPFTPAVRAHTPLVSSFDDLAAIPSPHMLRKSGVFTSLDFAPIPRFRNTDTMSDAGSIRSNRTGISAMHMNNIRAGAYRVSRLPPAAVGTKGDLHSSLRPTWEMR